MSSLTILKEQLQKMRKLNGLAEKQLSHLKQTRYNLGREISDREEAMEEIKESIKLLEGEAQ